MDLLPPWLVLFIAGIIAVIALLMACVWWIKLILKECCAKNGYVLLRNNEDQITAGMEAEQQVAVIPYYPPRGGTVREFSSQNQLVEGLSPLNQSTQRSQAILHFSSQNQLTQSTLHQEQAMQQCPRQGHQTQYHPQQQQSGQQFQLPPTSSQVHQFLTTYEIHNLQDRPPQYDELFPSK